MESSKKLQVGDVVVVDLDNPIISKILINKKKFIWGRNVSRYDELIEMLNLRGENKKKFGIIANIENAPNYNILWQEEPGKVYREYDLSQDEFTPIGYINGEETLKSILEKKIISFWLDPEKRRDDNPPRIVYSSNLPDLPDFEITPPPPPPPFPHNGGKKARKSRKSRKSRKVRKSYKKYRKSRKACKPRRRARK